MRLHWNAPPSVHQIKDVFGVVFQEPDGRWAATTESGRTITGFLYEQDADACLQDMLA